MIGTKILAQIRVSLFQEHKEIEDNLAKRIIKRLS